LGSDREEQLSQLLLKWEEAWDLGEDIAAADLCAGCPELTEALEGQIKLLKSMSWMKQEAADESIDPDQEDVMIGTTLADRYKIEAIVGFGGHGKVYRAFDPELDRHVAVKISKKVAVDNASDELLEEARRAAKLKHPGIVAVHDVGRHDGQLFFVTELVEGKNLADVIESNPTTVNESKRIISSLAEALNFAHEHGFLHRDIKPANVLIDHHGRVLITDFGIATTIDKIEDHRGGTPGTLPFMAPEQIAGEVQLIDGVGELVRGGGKVVKNAAGFDLPKMMCGSYGRLGIMTEITLKVLPRPTGQLTLEASASMSECRTTIQSLGMKCLPISGVDLTPIAESENLRIHVTCMAPEDSLSQIQEAVTASTDLTWHECGSLANSPLVSLAPSQFLYRLTTDIEQLQELHEFLRRTANLHPLIYSCSGKVAWCACDTPEHMDAIQPMLEELGVSAVSVAGAFAKPHFTGDIQWKSMANKIKLAIAPQKRFLNY